MTRNYSPLRYPGGKNSIFSFISSIIAENHSIGITYAEPYAGGAGLALRLLIEGFVNKIFINDLDYSIYSFWKTILESNAEFCRWLQKVDVTIENWTHYRSICSNPDNYSTFALGQATFFLNRTNVSGVIKGGVIGGLQQKGAYKISARFNKIDLIERIKTIGRYKNQIELSNVDGLDFLRKLGRTHDDILLYLDPPYVKKGSKLYMNYFSPSDHAMLSKYVNRLKGRYIVSYDNNELIFSLYQKQRKIIYDLQQSTSNKIGKEVLIFSDNLSFIDSITYISNPISVK